MVVVIGGGEYDDDDDDDDDDNGDVDASDNEKGQYNEETVWYMMT